MKFEKNARLTAVNKLFIDSEVVLLVTGYVFCHLKPVSIEFLHT